MSTRNETTAGSRPQVRTKGRSRATPRGAATSTGPKGCPWTATLIADEHGLYDPTSTADRIVLGSQAMSILAFVSDQRSISRILEHPGLRSPELDRPPPPREIFGVAKQGEGWGVPASWD